MRSEHVSSVDELDSDELLLVLRQLVGRIVTPLAGEMEEQVEVEEMPDMDEVDGRVGMGSEGDGETVAVAVASIGVGVVVLVLELAVLIVVGLDGGCCCIILCLLLVFLRATGLDIGMANARLYCWVRWVKTSLLNPSISFMRGLDEEEADGNTVAEVEVEAGLNANFDMAAELLGRDDESVPVMDGTVRNSDVVSATLVMGAGAGEDTTGGGDDVRSERRLVLLPDRSCRLLRLRLTANLDCVLEAVRLRWDDEADAEGTVGADLRSRVAFIRSANVDGDGDEDGDGDAAEAASERLDRFCVDDTGVVEVEMLGLILSSSSS